MHYCGCRQIPLIIDLIAEHEVASGLGAEAVAAMDRDDLHGARRLLDRMARELRAHWRGEENGLQEEDGLFPASLIALDGGAWNRSIAAWQEAHPGSRLQTRGS